MKNPHKPSVEKALYKTFYSAYSKYQSVFMSANEVHNSLGVLYTSNAIYIFTRVQAFITSQ